MHTYLRGGALVKGSPFDKNDDMKKIRLLIKLYVTAILSDCRPYRKWKGGAWYKVYDPNDLQDGLRTVIKFWTQDPAGYTILKTENNS